MLLNRLDIYLRVSSMSSCTAPLDTVAGVSIFPADISILYQSAT